MSEATNIISAFTEEQAAHLTGLTKRRLSYWDRTDFFKPAFGADNRRIAFSRIYSFRDLVSLRVLAVLLNQHGISLQHLRKVSAHLSHLGDERWTKTTLYVWKKKVYWEDPETGLPSEIVTGQYLLPSIKLEKVIADTKKDVVRLQERTPDKIGTISKNRNVSHNAAVIAGTRIPTAAIKRFHDAGYTNQQITQEYPGLTEKDIEAALAYEEKRSAA